MIKKTLIASALFGIFSNNFAIASAETDKLRQIISEQQKVLDSLEKRLDEADQKINATAEHIELEITKEDTTASRINIGGYGELHYNNYEDSDAEIDFHRFVLFFGHEFNESIRFLSEFELEL